MTGAIVNTICSGLSILLIGWIGFGVARYVHRLLTRSNEVSKIPLILLIFMSICVSLVFFIFVIDYLGYI